MNAIKKWWLTLRYGPQPQYESLVEFNSLSMILYSEYERQRKKAEHDTRIMAEARRAAEERHKRKHEEEEETLQRQRELVKTAKELGLEATEYSLHYGYVLAHYEEVCLRNDIELLTTAKEAGIPYKFRKDGLIAGRNALETKVANRFEKARKDAAAKAKKEEERIRLQRLKQENKDLRSKLADLENEVNYNNITLL